MSARTIRMSWDPITRIVGSLGIHATLDLGDRTVKECHSTSSIFRGYSIFMKGKDPRDAHFITSRICGICGDNHATCSVYARARGARSPPARRPSTSARSGMPSGARGRRRSCRTRASRRSPAERH